MGGFPWFELFGFGVGLFVFDFLFSFVQGCQSSLKFMVMLVKDFFRIALRSL